MIQQVLNKYLFAIIITCTCMVTAQAQVPPVPADTTKFIEWIYSDILRKQTVDSVTDLQIMIGKVELRHGNTLFFCDSAIINQRTRVLEAFGNVHINDADTVHVYSQYLIYYSSTRQAQLRKKVKLTDGKIELYTDDLDYNVGEGIGDYYKKGKIINGTSVLTSVEGTYYGDLKDIFFKKDVVLVDPQYNLKADSLLYNTESEIATFIGPTTIVDSSQKQIYTTSGYYDLKNKQAKFSNYSVITDPIAHTMITAQDIFSDDNTKITKLWVNALYVDSAKGQVLGGNYIEANTEANLFKATKEPYIIVKQDSDSLYVRADTLISGKFTDLLQELRNAALADTSVNAMDSATVWDLYPDLSTETLADSANRYFTAFRDVRIYSDSLQAVCDSLFYSGIDSVLRMYQKPVAWSNENQIKGDTMYVFTKNRQPEEIYVFENAFAVNESGEELYNQLKGRRINAFFNNGEISTIRARGNAESIYYIIDNDSAYVAVNKLAGEMIELRMVDKELNEVAGLGEPQGRMTPIQQATDTERKLQQFEWMDKIRPKSKYDILPNRVKIEE